MDPYIIDSPQRTDVAIQGFCGNLLMKRPGASFISHCVPHHGMRENVVLKFGFKQAPLQHPVFAHPQAAYLGYLYYGEAPYHSLVTSLLLSHFSSICRRLIA